MTLKDTEITRLARELSPYYVELRHRLHRRPELGMQEYETTALVRQELERLGVEICEIGLSTGCVALIHGTKPGKGKVIGLRADMDALPMDDLCGQPWASECPGKAHTCGHDFHTACLLAAAAGLMKLRDRFSGTVKLIFQPAEETLGGARHILEHNGLDNPMPEILVALHGTPAYKLGTYAVRAGKIMASSDQYVAVFHGKSAHASRPVEGRNALLAAAHAVIGIQEIIPNEVRTVEESVVSTCVLNAGTASNIVPDAATLIGTARALDPQVRDTIQAAVLRVTQAAAAMCGCTVEVDYQRGTPPVINDPEVVETLRAALEKAVDPENISDLKPLLGAEDFAFYTEIMPKTAFFRVGTGITDQDPTLHNARYDSPDEAMPYGIAAHLQLVLDVNG